MGKRLFTARWEYGLIRTFTDGYGLWRLFSSRHYQRVDALGSGVRLWAFGRQTGAASAATTRLGSHRTTPLSDLSDPSDPSDPSDLPRKQQKKRPFLRRSVLNLTLT